MIVPSRSTSLVPFSLALSLAPVAVAAGNSRARPKPPPQRTVVGIEFWARWVRRVGLRLRVLRTGGEG